MNGRYLQKIGKNRHLRTKNGCKKEGLLRQSLFLCKKFQKLKRLEEVGNKQGYIKELIRKDISR